MSVYDPLQEYLRQQSAAAVPMKFEEIESLIGRPLPASARKTPPWWSNNPSNSVITYAWLEAGYRSEQVDMAGSRLTFRRIRAQSAPQATIPGKPTPPRSGPHPVWSSPLRGTVKVADGVDLTEPLWEQSDDDR